MPIWLRNFTFKEINDFYEKEKEEIDRASGKEIVTANTDVNKLKSISSAAKVHVPDFVAKSKKPKK